MWLPVASTSCGGYMQRRHRTSLLAASLGALLLTAACSSSSTTKTTAKASASSPTSAATGASSASNDWALQYTGGKAAKADATLKPVIVGYVNQEGGVTAFPEATAGTEAAVKYVNAELGGVGGHPLQLKKCLVQAE